MKETITGASLIHYGYNYWNLGTLRKAGTAGTAQNATAKISKIARPAQMVSLVDSWDGTYGYYFVQDHTAGGKQVVHNRHDLGFNTVLVDGHVEGLKANAAPLSPYNDGLLGACTRDNNRWTRSGNEYTKDY